MDVKNLLHDVFEGVLIVSQKASISAFPFKKKIKISLLKKIYFC